MAQNVTIAGADFPDVPSIQIPKTGGGTAQFDDTTDADATAADIVSGKTAYVNGTKITGSATIGGVVISDTTDTHGGTIRTITTQNSVALQQRSGITPGASSVTVTPETGYDGMSSVQINGDANLIAANIKKDVNIFGITGTHQGTNWTKLATKEYSVNTTSSTAASVADITLDLADLQDTNAIIWVHIRDEAGKRAGYFYGSDSMFINYMHKNGSTSQLQTKPYAILYVGSNGSYSMSVSSYGVYARYVYHTSSNHYVQIYSRYSSSYGTINGTFKVEVYKLTMPSGFTLLD